MSLEAATYLNDLVTTNPAGADAKSQGDDHLRLLKTVLKASFPSITHAVYLDTASADVASASTTDIGAVTSNFVRITGTTTITSLGTATAGILRFVYFASALTLTHNATSLILPGAANITTAAGDAMVAISLGSGNWRVLFFQEAATSVGPVPTAPGGRLTLTTATPVQTADATAQTTIYYTPYLGFHAPLWNGAITRMVDLVSELSLALDNDSGHTGYHQSGKNFDLFIYDDAGTKRLLSGPAWTSDTARATALAYKNGFLTNNASMTGRFGSAAGNTVTVGQYYGLYVGTFRASANGQTAWVAAPAAAAGGGNCQLLLWNMYNRVAVRAISRDSTNSWNYTTATWRSANNSTSNRISLVVGVSEEAAIFIYSAFGENGISTGTVYLRVGVGFDATNAFIAGSLPGVALINGESNNTPIQLTARYDTVVTIGFHFGQAVEWSTASDTTTWYGDDGDATLTQTGLILVTRM